MSVLSQISNCQGLGRKNKHYILKTDRIANHKKARYALRTLPCAGRGMASPLQPRRPRLKWNRANEARWNRQGEGGHQVVRYNTTQHDGRWLCMRCGLHYVRFCGLRAKQCVGAPGNQAATKSVADALAGGPHNRRKVHAFAKHPPGSRPGAPGARLPSDVFVFDPSVPKPSGPATPRPNREPLRVPEARPRSRAPWAVTKMLNHGSPRGNRASPPPPVEHAPRVAAQAHGHQGEAPSEPKTEAVGLLPRNPGEECKPEGGKAAPTGAQGIHASLGLGPSQVPPGTRQKAAKAIQTGKPARAKAKRTPRGSGSQESPGAKSQEGPSGSPVCHIHQWLQRTGVAGAGAMACTHGAPGSSNDPPPEARPADGGVTLGTRVVTVCDPWPPGSSTDPPRGTATPGRECPFS